MISWCPNISGTEEAAQKNTQTSHSQQPKIMENEGWRMITMCDEQAAKRDLSIYCSFTCRYRLPSLMS